VGQIVPGHIDGLDIVGHDIVHHAGQIGRHRGSTQFLLGHVLTGAGFHQWRASGKDRGRLGHDGEVAQRGGQGPVAGRRTEDQTDQRDLSRQPGQTLEVPGTSSGGRSGEPVAGPFEHQDQRHLLLCGELAQAESLVRRAGPDRSAEHGHVLGPGQRRPTADASRSCYQGVSGYRRLGPSPDQLADLVEGARVEQGSNALAGVESVPTPLALQARLAAHGHRLGLATFDLLEGRPPSESVVFHCRSPCRPRPRPSSPTPGRIMVATAAH
jgi:hypothetical protein